MEDQARCRICKRFLDSPGDETTQDCGGDCLKCMADYGLDPNCIDAMWKITGDVQYEPRP